MIGMNGKLDNFRRMKETYASGFTTIVFRLRNSLDKYAIKNRDVPKGGGAGGGTPPPPKANFVGKFCRQIWDKLVRFRYYQAEYIRI